MIKFDFVIGDFLFDKIKNLAEIKNIKISTLVRDIILKMIPLLEKKHFKEARRKKDYPIVMATHRIKVFLPERLYNELKVIHDHLNTFSMATLIREIMEAYFQSVEKLGEKEFEEMIKKLEDKIERIKKKRGSINKWGGDIPINIAKLYIYLIGLDKNFCLRKIKFL
ncbi:MAG TPA: hypothetical protein PLE45_08010 [Spirochaetota bacterium]|nr:hypothetical protein [Spirochaetota bacterium]HOL57130.1 hypothetical protein [Spirochaetota bacterium]HPP04685.1 hypothetical protein [Spirochaetota bacterium]